MHYKNGREAKNGDKVIWCPDYPTGLNHDAPFVGILFGAVPGNDSCNGSLAPFAAGPHYANLSECLHVDDALALLNQKPAPAAADNEPTKP